MLNKAEDKKEHYVESVSVDSVVRCFTHAETMHSSLISVNVDIYYEHLLIEPTSSYVCPIVGSSL